MLIEKSKSLQKISEEAKTMNLNLQFKNMDHLVNNTFLPQIIPKFMSKSPNKSRPVR